MSGELPHGLRRLRSLDEAVFDRQVEMVAGAFLEQIARYPYAPHPGHADYMLFIGMIAQEVAERARAAGFFEEAIAEGLARAMTALGL